jgi:hypothetical protein
MGYASFDPQDDRAYIRYAFREIEDEIDLDPEWWRGNIGPVLSLNFLFMFLFYAPYLYLTRTIVANGYGSWRQFFIMMNLNFYAFMFFLYVLFSIVIKIVRCLCVRCRWVRTIEEYKDICKWTFYVLSVLMLCGFVNVYIPWLISDYVKK